MAERKGLRDRAFGGLILLAAFVMFIKTQTLAAFHPPFNYSAVGRKYDACRHARSSELHGPISQALAASIVSIMTETRPSSADCPVFMTKFKATQAYTAWTPYTRPYQQRLDNMACQSDEFCDTMYPIRETANVAQWIYDSQHPRACSRARYLIVTNEWDGGLGSTIHIKAITLLSALATGRVLVDSHQIKWHLTNPANCPEQNWQCYFAAMTSCSVPPACTSPREFNMTGHRGQASWPSDACLKTRSTDNPGGIDLSQVVSRLQTLKPEFRDKPASWWMTHATTYLIRPNQRTINAACHHWSCVMGGAKEPVRPMASVFVRSGDKWQEATLYNASAYFDQLESFSLSHPYLRPTSVYFGTDDVKVLKQSVLDYGLRWNISWLSYHRDHAGLTFDEVERRYQSPLAEWQVLISLSDLYISATADIFVGTLSSNWCRLTDELRKVQGKARVPYLTPEGTLFAGF